MNDDRANQYEGEVIPGAPEGTEHYIVERGPAGTQHHYHSDGIPSHDWHVHADGDTVHHHPVEYAHTNVPPIDENSLRRDIADHLEAMHTWNWGASLAGGKKANKESLLSLHRKFHELESGRSARSSTWNSVRHLHAEVAPLPAVPVKGTTDVSTAVANAKAKGGITASERSVLRQLIDNDAKDLEQDLRQMASDAARAARGRIAEEFAELEALARTFEQAMADLDAEHKSKTEELKAAAAARGLEWWPTGRSFRPASRAKAEQQAGQQVEADLQRALRTLTSQRLRLQRQILLLGIQSDVAEQIIEALPTAADLMRAAAQAADQQAADRELTQ